MGRNRFYLFLCICFLLVVCLLILFSPVFTVTTVEITGNNKLSVETVRNVTGLNKMPNIFAFSSYRAKKALKADQYVEKVDIVKEYPDHVKVSITERRLSGYVEYMGRYLYIDENGRVLEVAYQFTQRLPVIVGLTFQEFNVGQILEVDNQSSFDTVVTLARLFNKYDMQTDIIRVDVSKVDNIHLYIYNIDVEFGDIKDADMKIRTLKEIMEKLPNAKEVKGFLDIKNIALPPRFRLLT